MDWSSYHSRINTKPATMRERIIQSTHNTIAKNQVNSHAYKQAIIGEEEVEIIMIYSDKEHIKKFQALPGQPIKLGDIMEWNGLHWIVTDLDYDDELMMRGILALCNRQIQWQNHTTREIVSTWCTIQQISTIDVVESQLVNMSEREFVLQMPLNEENGNVDLDKRIMLEWINTTPKTYKVIRVNKQDGVFVEREGGLLEWVIAQDEYNPLTDRADLGICNYLPPLDPPPIPEPDPEDPDPPDPTPGFLGACIIKYKGSAEVREGGFAKVFTAEVMNDDRTLATVPVTWTYNEVPGVTVEANDTTCSITASEEANIGDVIQLTLSAEEYQPQTLEVEVVPLV